MRNEEFRYALLCNAFFRRREFIPALQGFSPAPNDQ